MKKDKKVFDDIGKVENEKESKKKEA
jgi:hypothetical protein